MDYNLFLRYNKFADSYKMSQPNIYFFLKDCVFQRIYKANGNRFPNPESQNMCNSFQIEMQQAQWQRQKMTKDEYKRFLEHFFKKMDFKTVDLETCEILKLITENLGIFGGFDDLTNKRIIYFNKKIESLKQNQPRNVPQTTDNQTHHHQHHHHHHTTQNTVPQNTGLNSNYGNVNLDLPDPGKDKKAKDAKKAAQAAEDARLNEIMRQYKLNSPIYITNVEPGKFYNPYTNPQYIPKGINKSIPLPMDKKSPNYPKLKAIIEEELILANQELDYHKIDMARNHLERAAYYLKNVID